MDGNCNLESIIYQAEVTSQTTQTTELSKQVWNFKDKNIQYNIKWHKIKQAQSLFQCNKEM